MKKTLSRRAFITALSAAAARAAWTDNLGGPVARKRPNVVLILTDDQGSMDVGCYGASDLHTPNMDALAGRGVRFTQFYAASAICSPSRGALLTGRYPLRNGLIGNAGAAMGLAAEEITMAELFRDAGYRTAVFGKWHLGMAEEMAPGRQGFDEFFGHKEGCIDNYSHFFYWSGPNRHDLWRNEDRVREDGEFFPDMVTSEACRFLEENRDHPFFLYLPFNLPHYPMQAQEEFDALYENTEQPRRRYAAFVSNLDDCIGAVMRKVDDLGLRENTIFVFHSDNGHSVEERAFFGGGNAGPYRGHKFLFFEGGIRMPCLVSWPGVIPENEVRPQMVSSMDWLPTLAAYCGLDIRNLLLDGDSLVNIIRDEETPSPHAVLHWMVHTHWAVREGDWKLVCNAPETKLENTKEPAVALWLSNLSEDPGETRNLAEIHPEKVAALTLLHEQWVENCKKKK